MIVVLLVADLLNFFTKTAAGVDFHPRRGKKSNLHTIKIAAGLSLNMDDFSRVHFFAINP